MECVIRIARTIFTGDARHIKRALHNAVCGKGCPAVSIAVIGDNVRDILIRVIRRRIILLSYIGKREIYPAFCDRIVGRRIERCNRRAIDLDRVVARICRIGLDGVLYRLVRACILIRIGRRRRVLVTADESLERYEIIRARNNLACAVLCRADDIHRRVVGLCERAVDCRCDSFRRNDAVTLFLQRRYPSKREVSA